MTLCAFVFDFATILVLLVDHNRTFFNRNLRMSTVSVQLFRRYHSVLSKHRKEVDT